MKITALIVSTIGILIIAETTSYLTALGLLAFVVGSELYSKNS